MNRGVLLALGAYVLWGLLPIYLHELAGVTPLEVLAHRVLWSMATMAVLLLALRRFGGFAPLREQPARVLRFVATALLISLNWLLYIWSVQSGHVVDASLGYFINPLVTLVLGRLLLDERLRRGQYVPVAVMVAGVAWLAVQAGGVPWIGLGLAISFAFYGLLRKTSGLGSLEGFTVEVAVLLPLSVAYLLWGHGDTPTSFVQGDAWHRFLLVLAGPATTVPLLLFGAAARRIPLSTLGLLQYAGPTLQWLTGILLFHEEFQRSKAIGFGMIWLALVIYVAEGLLVGWLRRREAAADRTREAGAT